MLLVDPRALSRESFVHLVLCAGCAYDVVAVATARELGEFAPSSKSMDLGIINIGSARVRDPYVMDEIGHLHRLFAAMPLAILADLEDSDEVHSALRLGIRAYIPAYLDGARVLAGLRIVLAGGIFVPAAPSPSVPLGVSEEHAEAAGAASLRSGSACARSPLHLTLREMDVLRLLQQGKTNRGIACELNIAEATAKVHVRSIKYKLNATNRLDVVGFAGTDHVRDTRIVDENLD